MKRIGIMTAALMAVSACATQQPSTGYTFGGDLRVAAIGGEKPVSSRATVSFDAGNNRVAAYFGCNRMIGGYQQKGSTLTFTPMASTRMACMGPNDDDKAAKALETVRTWRFDSSVEGGQLYLLDENGAAVMRLQPLQADAEAR